MTRRNVKITVPALTRVEGEGALDLEIRDGRIDRLQLRIYEPPRFFEKFLEGRSYQDVPDAVARICGICPVAYQMSAVQALETILQLSPSPWVLDMRRLMYCGEWIQSHSLHIHLLAAPDFLGFNDVTQMAARYAGEVRRGLALQSIGNELIALFGGRSVHPVGVRTGGFTRAPRSQETEAIREKVEAAIPQAEALVRWVASLELPAHEQDFVSVAMRHENEYPMYSGRLVSSQGLDIDIQQFDEFFQEHQEPHSTALHCLLQGKPYLVGPLARMNLNQDRLPPEVNALLQNCGIQFPSRNMFHSVVARAAEILLCLHEARRLLYEYEETDTPFWEEEVREGIGCGCTEAPRGILWHQYNIDEKGLVRSARIVPPTSQNQARIEADLHDAIMKIGIDQEEDLLRSHAEKVIRNYDPCISCATHFLHLNLQRDLPGDLPLSPVERRNTITDVFVLGIGSPSGNDQFGWDVIDALQPVSEIPEGIRMRTLKLDRPGSDLIQYLDEADYIILVDAIDGQDFDEVIKVWKFTGGIKEVGALYSTHAFGVMESLYLNDVLKKVRPPVYLVGLTLDAENVIPEYRQQHVADAIDVILGLLRK